MPLERRPTPTRRAAILSALALAGVPASTSAAVPDDGGPPPLGNGAHQFTELDPVRALPPIALPDRHGRAIPLRADVARATLLHIWATWCPACRADLAALRDAWRADPPFALLTICTDVGAPSAVDRFLGAEALGSLPVLLDPGGRAVTAPRADGTASPIQPIALPMSYVVDRAGGVRGYIAGVADWRSAEARALLAFYGRG